MPNSFKIFQEKIENELERRKWSHADLARAMKCDPAQLNRWISGENEPRLNAIDKIANALGLEPSVLISKAPLPAIIKVEMTEEEIIARVKRAFESERELAHLKQQIEEDREISTKAN